MKCVRFEVVRAGTMKIFWDVKSGRSAHTFQPEHAACTYWLRESGRKQASSRRRYITYYSTSQNRNILQGKENTINSDVSLLGTVRRLTEQRESQDRVKWVDVRAEPGTIVILNFSKTKPAEPNTRCFLNRNFCTVHTFITHVLHIYFYGTMYNNNLSHKN
jgi:hypothetical protein